MKPSGPPNLLRRAFWDQIERETWLFIVTWMAETVNYLHADGAAVTQVPLPAPLAARKESMSNGRSITA
jgi:hypothetical protein